MDNGKVDCKEKKLEINIKQIKDYTWTPSSYDKIHV